ncbi:unnamed protein product [Rodentolepis nana]|uniref:DUF4471 domain-containing protein n=1 Tax=Rodentolepis nana TaxID=102285 RepID=A0A0R3TPE3_RODNA|nr:unnamed protein product [Rodentolepis nana]
MLINDSEALGYIVWWGLTPAINIFEGFNEDRENGIIFLEEKTELFLELYGNSLIRESSEIWLDETASKFIRYIPKFSLSIENSGLSQIQENSRVRQHLGVRYDAIPNVFDWDCSITLRDRGINTFESKEYGRWRSSGVAFSPREASYLSPNRSLASPRYFSYRHARNDLAGSTLIGYWGDIVCSPYLAFGTFTDRSPEHSKTLPGGRIVYGAAVLSEINLRCLLWEMQNGKKAPASIASVEFCADANESKSFFNDFQFHYMPKRYLMTPRLKNWQNSAFPYSTIYLAIYIILAEIAEAEVNLCEKFFMDFYSPGTTFVDLTTRLRSKFIDDTNKASIIYVGISSLVDLEKASGELLDICTDDCKLIIESVLYIIGLKEENIRGYVKRAQDIASSIGFKLEKPVDAMKDHHLYFVRNKKPVIST